MKWNSLEHVLREADGGAGGAPSGTPAPAPAPAPAAPAAPQGGDAAPSPAPAPAAPRDLAARAEEIVQGKQPPAADPAKPGTLYTPEGLAESFRGKTDQETIDKLLAEVSSRGQVPAAAKDYTFTPSEKFKAARGDLKDDPFIPIWQQIAYEEKLTSTQYSNVIQKIYEGMENAGMLEKPMDWDAELSKLAPKDADPRDREIKAAARVYALSGLIKGLETRKEITKAEAVLLSSIYASASSVVAFEKLFEAVKRGSEHGVQPGGAGGAGGAYTWDEADRDMRDERYSTTSPKHDPRFRADADRKMANLAPRKAYRVS